MSDEPTDIIETLESIREKKYPEIPSDLVKEIVESEYETLENRKESLNRVSNLVESYLEEVDQTDASN
jgi:uncharacterized protein Yka (UPF0111/DUF47 family)